MTWGGANNKSINISFKWPNIVTVWERRENHILANILSKNGVGVQKCPILSQPPSHFRQYHQPDYVARYPWQWRIQEFTDGGGGRLVKKWYTPELALICSRGVRGVCGKNAIGKNAIGKIAIGKNAIGKNAIWYKCHW